MGNGMTKKMIQGFSITARRIGILALVSLSMVLNPGTLYEAVAAGPSPEDTVNCSIQEGPCTRHLAGRTVTLDILPKPVRAMKDLRFRVTLSGDQRAAALYIELGMPGMDMGPNRVELLQISDNVFEGQGIIVRCASGRRTWKATVTLPEVGKVDFVFDVHN
jgi:hypothetical protein